MNDLNEHLRPREVRQLLGISVKTLFTWTHSGKIESIRTPTGQYRYPRKNILAPKDLSDKSNFCYCRVSTRGQSSDLQRQIDFFRSRYPDYIIIKDIGSGLNFKRKGFQSLLESSLKGVVGEIVVTHRDRLCRFGFDLFEHIVSKCSNGKIVVLDQRETSPQQELVHDLLSIITVFSSRLYGLRSHSLKKKLHQIINEECQIKEEYQLQDSQGSTLTDTGTNDSSAVDYGSISMVL